MFKDTSHLRAVSTEHGLVEGSANMNEKNSEMWFCSVSNEAHERFWNDLSQFVLNNNSEFEPQNEAGNLDRLLNGFIKRISIINPFVATVVTCLSEEMRGGNSQNGIVKLTSRVGKCRTSITWMHCFNSYVLCSGASCRSAFRGCCWSCTCSIFPKRTILLSTILRF